MKKYGKSPLAAVAGNHVVVAMATAAVPIQPFHFNTFPFNLPLNSILQIDIILLDFVVQVNSVKLIQVNWAQDEF